MFYACHEIHLAETFVVICMVNSTAWIAEIEIPHSSAALADYSTLWLVFLPILEPAPSQREVGSSWDHDRAHYIFWTIYLESPKVTGISIFGVEIRTF
jgi:hypothetical protein